MLGAVFRLRPGRPVEHQRLDPAAGPAADPDLGEIADVVGVQMGREIGGDVLMRDFERGEVVCEPEPKSITNLSPLPSSISHEQLACAAPHERPAGAERGDAHLVGGERLGVGKVVVADNSQGDHSGSRFGCVAIINALALIRRSSRHQRFEICALNPCSSRR